eukprot:3471536-Prymnesium_polylepis.2
MPLRGQRQVVRHLLHAVVAITAAVTATATAAAADTLGHYVFRPGLFGHQVREPFFDPHVKHLQHATRVAYTHTLSSRAEGAQAGDKPNAEVCTCAG